MARTYTKQELNDNIFLPECLPLTYDKMGSMFPDAAHLKKGPYYRDGIRFLAPLKYDWAICFNGENAFDRYTFDGEEWVYYYTMSLEPCISLPVRVYAGDPEDEEIERKLKKKRKKKGVKNGK